MYPRIEANVLSKGDLVTAAEGLVDDDQIRFVRGSQMLTGIKQFDPGERAIGAISTLSSALKFKVFTCYVLSCKPRQAMLRAAKLSFLWPLSLKRALACKPAADGPQ